MCFIISRKKNEILQKILDNQSITPLVKSVYQKLNFLSYYVVDTQKTVSMRQFFWAPKRYFKTDLVQFYAKIFLLL